MRITGLSICLVLLVFSGLKVRAAEETPFSALAQLATALSENDVDGALGFFDPAMKDRGEIENRIEALVQQAEIACSLDVVTDDEQGGVHKLDVDWFFQLTSQADESRLERRRERVAIEMRLVKGHWRITALSPLKILDPLQIQ
jgi:hypothetical protein